jgi:anti-sigma factor RsiW
LPSDQHIPYENLGRYLNNDVDADERSAIDRHLEDCPACRQDLSDAQSWQSHLATLPAAKSKGASFPWLLCAALTVIASLLAWYWLRY